MSDLVFAEKQRLEELFGMRSGYVLGFSDRTFNDLVEEVTGRSILDARYAENGTSKANRLRTFWKLEPNQIVGKLIAALIDWTPTDPNTWERRQLFASCVAVAERLLQSGPTEILDGISPPGENEDFEPYLSAIRDALEKEKPSDALDRLHAFSLKLIRSYAERHGVDIGGDKPIHSAFGEYVGALRENGFIASESTARLLRASGKLMEPFNDIRNKESLAHPNPIMNHDEGLFVFNQICGVLRFISSVEEKAAKVRNPGGDDSEG